MPIKVTCQNCGGALHAPDDSLGKRGRCPTCGTILTITPDAAAGAPPAFGAPHVAGGQPHQTPLNNPWGSLPGGPEEANASSAAGLPQRPQQSIAPPPAMSAPTAAPSPYGMKDSGPAAPNPWGTPTAPKVPEHGPHHSSRLPPDPRKFPVADPFAKPGRPPVSDDEEGARRWLKVKRGLGWMQAAVFFGLLGVLGFAAIPILQTIGVNIPGNVPGYLKVPGLSQTTEIHAAAALVPLLLAMLCKFIGRITVTGAPASSYARGLALIASLATMLAIAGAGAYLVLTGSAMRAPDGESVWFPKAIGLQASDPFWMTVDKTLSSLTMPRDEMIGKIQRVGLIVMVAFGLLAEINFVAALGRMAAALRNSTAAGRVNRFVIYVTFIIGAATVAAIAYHLFYDQVGAKMEGAVKWDEKGRVYGLFGGIAVVGLLGAMVYWRMLSGVKRAIRETYDS